MKSQPTYGGLRPVAASRRNIVVVDVAGVEAAARLLEQAPDGFADRTEVLVIAPAGSTSPELPAAGVAVDRATDAEQALRELDARLTTATMGLRLYAAGSEGLVGRVIRLAADHGIDPRSVLTEQVGSQARRVQCVHCKATTESVTTSLYDCSCGLLLMVRDHYSYRLAAYQGVCVNAEDPTERPTPEVAFA